jgi:hypothetical protein
MTALIWIGSVACAATNRPPTFVQIAENAPAITSSRATSPSEWRLAIVDVETTGLFAGYHEMIDLGLVMTDLDGRVIDSLFVRIQPEHPQTWDGSTFDWKWRFSTT